MSEQHHHPKLAESAVALRAVRSEERGRLYWVLALTAVVMAGEFVAARITRSLALENDAYHFLTHFVTIALSVVAIAFATRPAPPDKTYRYWRLEILASLISGLSLIPVSGYILYEAVRDWIHPVEIKVGGMLAVAGVGLLANLLSAALLHRHSKHDLNIRGAFVHMLADCVSSLGVVAAGAVIWFTGWTRADSLIAGGISLLILSWCFSLVRDSSRILLESAPKHMKLDEICAAMKTVEGVLEVHDLHVWTITSRMYALTAHVRLREDLAVSQAEAIGCSLQKLLDERWEINHATLQFEVAPGQALACERGGAAAPGSAAGHDHHH
jgi:cobalt-zinc-cadmium efflux system protein